MDIFNGNSKGCFGRLLNLFLTTTMVYLCEKSRDNDETWPSQPLLGSGVTWFIAVDNLIRIYSATLKCKETLRTHPYPSYERQCSTVQYSTGVETCESVSRAWWSGQGQVLTMSYLNRSTLSRLSGSMTSWTSFLQFHCEFNNVFMVSFS